MDVVASYLGCTAAALRLLLGVLCGYPLAIVYRRYISTRKPVVQHAFFTVTGLALIISNYGWDTIHSLANISVVYVVMLFAGRTSAAVAFNFLFTLGYLLAGYYLTATENYDIKWTMPHCILCLRLIGVSFDYYDGGEKDPKLPMDRRATALRDLPTPLEMLGHSYFFGGCMVGPQFPMKRYRDFVEGTLWPAQKRESADSVPYSVQRLLFGFATMALHQVGIIFVNEKVLLSEDFLNSWSLMARWLFLGLYSTVILHKYVACWLMAEGSCSLTGLSYNGKDEHGKNRWDGLRNVGLWQYETSTNFDGLIRSFNINTNRWVAQYVFKRLKFLGNKDLSQIGALFFLALWHGFHFGYYVSFVMEFLVMKFERDMTSIIDMTPSVRAVVYHEKLQWLRVIFMRVYVSCLMGFCIIPFTLLKVQKFHRAYAAFYYLPSLLLAAWLVASFRVMPSLRKSAKKNGTAVDAASTTALKKD
ncbi:lysophospholipid acyltransferase 5 [Galendromus occidentalis]|uniref:Lysophospholipid acyltransferase 5 n=1 Tax=Galendromus occidentalis TaxID=34638 RepID=A0AAJ7SJ74_9ACAR|nr:lysophospholipid acyltransferase 5 [Galendromus occidentalis]